MLPPIAHPAEAFATQIVVFTRDRPGMLVEVSSVVSAASVNIIDVRSRTRQIGGESAFQYKVQVSSLAMVEDLFKAVETLDDVVRVMRGDMEHMLHDYSADFWALARESGEGQS